MKHIYAFAVLLIAIQLFFSSCREKSLTQNVSQTSEESNKIPFIPQKINLQLSEELLRTAALEGDYNEVEKLLAMNVDVNSINQDGLTALMLASYNGNLEIVKSLIEKGAKINLQDYNGRSALMFASSGKFPATVEFLLNNEADPNLVDSEEHFTALMFAAAEGNIDVVKLLLSGTADPKRKDVDGETAELFARNNGHVEVEELLRERQ